MLVRNSNNTNSGYILVITAYVSMTLPQSSNALMVIVALSMSYLQDCFTSEDSYLTTYNGSLRYVVILTDVGTQRIPLQECSLAVDTNPMFHLHPPNQE